MDFASAFRAAVAHITRKTKFFGLYEYRVLGEVPRTQVGGPVGDARITLQIVTIADGLPDLLSIEKVHGSPATSEVCRPSSRVLVGFKAGDPGQPFVAHYLASTPLTAYLDATNAVRIGPSLEPGMPIVLGVSNPQPVALAPATIAAFQAIEQYTSAVSAFANAVAGAVPALSAAAAALISAQVALVAALAPLLGSAPTGLSSTRTSSD